MDFFHPIPERNNEELIAIANSTNEEWQQAAIEQAREELNNRGITKEYEQNTILRWEEEQLQLELEYQNELEHNVSKTYSFHEMAAIFFTATFILGGRLRRSSDLSLSELKHENYQKKFRQRIVLLFGGIAFWIVLMFSAFVSHERKWQSKIDQTDISDWENNYRGKEDEQPKDTLLH